MYQQKTFISIVIYKSKMCGIIKGKAGNFMDNEAIIQDLTRQRLNISFDEEVCYGVELTSIDLKKLMNDLHTFTNKTIDEQQLLNLKLLKKEANSLLPTNGLVLLSTNNYFDQAIIKCARFKGNTINEFIDQKEFSGPLYEQVENTMLFAKQYIAKAGKITELQRIDTYEISMIAIREAIVNAVVHRDYSIQGTPIYFAIFDNRIEITSPGSLPNSIELTSLENGRSEIRNKSIARLFKEIQFIEQWGTGIKRIISECKNNGLEKPLFEELANSFKITIHKKIESNTITKVDTKNRSVNVNNMQNIIDYLTTHPTITSKVVRENFDLKETASINILRKMCDEHILLPVGNGKNRHYILNKID